MVIRFHSAVLVPGDDQVFQDADAIYGSLGAAVNTMYTLWGGRIVILIIANILLNIPLPLLRLILSALMAILAYYLVRLTDILFRLEKDNQFFIVSAVCTTVFMVMSPVLFHASIDWFTGFFFYPLPMLGYLMGIVPFLSAVFDEPCRWWSFAAAVLGLFICPYMEQTAVLFAASALVCLGVLLYYKKNRRSLWYLYGWGILHFAIEFAAPGNAIRNRAESLKWFPGFEMLGIPEKSLMGLFHSSYTFLQNDFSLVLILLALLLLIGYRQDKMALIWSFCLLFSGFFVKKVIISKADDNSWRLYDRSYWMATGLLLLWILLLLVTIYFFVQQKIRAVIVMLFTAAAVLEGILMGFSPTVYESGSRTIFFSYILLTLVCCMLAGELLSVTQAPSDDSAQ